MAVTITVLGNIMTQSKAFKSAHFRPDHSRHRCQYPFPCIISSPYHTSSSINIVLRSVNWSQGKGPDLMRV